MKKNLSKHEPAPTDSDHPACWDLVQRDIDERDRYGQNKYGTRLKPFNGRNVGIDAYQEALDLVVYARQMVYELEALYRAAAVEGCPQPKTIAEVIAVIERLK